MLLWLHGVFSLWAFYAPFLGIVGIGLWSRVQRRQQNDWPPDSSQSIKDPTWLQNCPRTAQEMKCQWQQRGFVLCAVRICPFSPNSLILLIKGGACRRKMDRLKGPTRPRWQPWKCFRHHHLLPHAHPSAFFQLPLYFFPFLLKIWRK